MASRSSSFFWVIIFIYADAVSSSLLVRAHEQNGNEAVTSVGRRLLLGFKETPRGSNVTFECSPSGPCVPCISSEKKKEKFRCSETGYRIPLKCKEVREGSNKKDDQQTQNGQSDLNDEEVAASTKPRTQLDDSPPSKQKSQSYKTYRSCVPSAEEEKLSVLGFEAIMLGLFVMSGTAIYIRKRQMVPMLGVSSGRSQSNSRF